MTLRYSAWISFLNYVSYVPYLLTYLRAFVSYISVCLCMLCAYVSNVFYLSACLCLFHGYVPVCVRVLRVCYRCFTCLCAFTQLFAFTRQLCALERQKTRYHLENMVSMSMLAKSEYEIITETVIRRCS